MGIKLTNKIKQVKDSLEYVAYCSQCWAPVEVEETPDYIKCKSCGHTKPKNKVKKMTGIQVISKYTKAHKK